MLDKTNEIATALAGYAPKLPLLANSVCYSINSRSPGALPVSTPMTAEQLRCLNELYSGPTIKSALQQLIESSQANYK